MLNDYWPLFGLRLTTPRLELRYASQDDLVAFIDLAARGVHDPAVMPFTVPWTRRPLPEMARESLRHYWSSWAEWTPEDWRLPFAVVFEGEVVGVQDCSGHAFVQRREIGSGSWLGLAYQGRGLGTEMRAAMLEFAFTGLGAHWTVSEAFSDNAASLAVSRRLGYTDEGFAVYPGDDGPRISRRLRLDRETWESRREVPVEISGLGPCLGMFGLAPDAADVMSSP